MENVRTIYLDWNTGGIVRSDSGAYLARQYDHLSNLVVIRNAPGLENYYLIVEMKEDEDDLAARSMEPILLSGPYWLVPNVYTQLVQPVTFQVCCKTESGDFEQHSAKFKLNVVESLDHDGSAVDVDPSPMYDAYKDYVDEKVQELIDEAGGISIDTRAYVDQKITEMVAAAGEVIIDSTLSISGAAADAKATGDAISETNERLVLLKEPVVITHSETVEKGYHVLTFDEPILRGTEVTVIGTAATPSNSFTAIFRDSNGNSLNLGTLGISKKKLTGVLEFDAVDFRSFVNGTEWGFTITYGDGVVAEVEDVREGVNGVVYGSAGEAVRTQVKGIEDVVNIVGQKTLFLLDIGPYATSENWTLKENGLSESNSDGRIRKYSVTPGQLLYLSISKDTYGVYQFQNNASIPGGNINNYLVGYPVTEAVNGFVVVPDGATYLIVSQLKTNVTNAIKLADSVSSATDIISLNESIRSLMIQAARPKNLSYNAYLNEPKPLMLLHFSDIHGDSTELARMVEFADSNSDMIDDTICTGDVLATRWSSDFNYWSAVPGAEKILLAVGNHDVLTDTSGWDWSQRASQADQYTRFFAPFIGDWECSYESGKTHYYKDYDESKIRLIVLNCMLTGSDDTAQLTWLGTALSGAKAKEYSVVVANHYMIATPTKIPCNFSSIDKGVGSDVLPTAYLSAIQNFIDDSGKFICHIAGHTHWDIVVRSRDYPRQICIVVDALSRTQGNYYSDTQRTNGDKSQDLANVVAFDTSSGVVKVMRVGADTDHYLRQKHCLTIDYATGNIVAES